MSRIFYEKQLHNKKILFITTKNLDYIRNSQEISLLQESCGEQGKVSIIGSKAKGYGKRLFQVYTSLFMTKLSDYDVVFVGFAPQLVMCFPFIGGKIRRWRRKASPEKEKLLIIDFFISMYDTLIWDRKKFKASSIIAKLLHLLDQKTFQSTDMVVCDTKAHGQYFSEEFGQALETMKTLYLEADSSIYHPMDDACLQEETEESTMNATTKDFTVLYFGSILPLQGVDVVLEAARICCDANLRFVIIGPIPAAYQKPDNQNITYYDWLSQEDLAQEIGKADLCLAGHFNGSIQKAKRTIPGKAYIYHAMNKPMILGDNPANHELFDESMKGIYFVPMSDPQRLAELIRNIKEKH